MKSSEKKIPKEEIEARVKAIDAKMTANLAAAALKSKQEK